MLGSDGIGHQLLGVAEVSVAGVPVVQSAGGQHIVEERVAAQHPQRMWIYTATLPMTWRGETVTVRPVVVRDGVEQGSNVLVHGERVPAARFTEPRIG